MKRLVRPNERSKTENEYAKPDKAEFMAKIRYSGPNEIVTIPKKVSRELGIKLGDTVIIHIKKTGDEIGKTDK